MNATRWLVVLRHEMDDLPLYLVDDKDSAERLAKAVKPEQGELMASLFGVDSSTPVSVWVIQFAGMRPEAAYQVKNFDETFIEKAPLVITGQGSSQVDLHERDL